MQLQRATPIVGIRRPRVIARLAIASIVTVLCLQSLPAQAMAESTTSRSPCTAVSRMLAKASNGLLMPSESDFPFTPFHWANAATRRLTIPRLLAQTGQAPGTAVEVVDLDVFFRNVAQHQPWHDRQQTMDVRRFQRLVRVIDRHLDDVRVFRIGTVRIDAYIVGRCGRHLTGLSTTLIET